MITLWGLWLVSLILSGIALVIMTGLILGRLFEGRRRRSRDAERRRLVPLLLGAEPSREVIAEVEHAPNLLTDVATELIQLVRGEDRDDFVASAGRLGVPQRLRHRLLKGAPRVRVLAAEALAAFADPESIGALRKALGDRNPDVRLSAALALARIDAAPPAPELVRALELGTSEQSKLIVSLFEELARTRPEEVRALIVDPDMPPLVKAGAIDALSESGDYSLVPAIAGLALEAEPDNEALPRYIRALGRFGHPAAGKAVQSALESPTWWVRAAAAEAAGRIGLYETALTLTRLLDDPEWWVRFRAGEALTRLGEPGLRLLQESARCGSERSRRAAAMTLAERGDAA